MTQQIFKNLKTKFLLGQIINDENVFNLKIKRFNFKTANIWIVCSNLC